MQNRLILVVLLLLAPAIGSAETGITVSLASDYVWRGVSQTLTDPALQGEIEYAHDGGLYAGAWASNVDFFDEGAPGADPADDDGADLELNYYVGFSHEPDDGLSWDVGLIGYAYPGSDLDTSVEAYVAAGMHGFQLSVYRDFDNDSTYFQVGYGTELPGEVSMELQVGFFDLEEDASYSDYRLAFSRVFHGFDVELAWTYADLDEEECLEFGGREDLCDGRVVLTVSREFGG